MPVERSRFTRRRHWRQRFDPTLRMVFRRPMTVGTERGTERFAPGDEVPPEVSVRKLRAWWNAHRIELWDFTPPESQLDDKAMVRSAAIKEAIEGLDPTDPALWTKSGAPRVQAIELALGLDITTAERNAVWAGMQGG